MMAFHFSEEAEKDFEDSSQEDVFMSKSSGMYLISYHIKKLVRAITHLLSKRIVCPSMLKHSLMLKLALFESALGHLATVTTRTTSPPVNSSWSLFTARVWVWNEDTQGGGKAEPEQQKLDMTSG